LLTSEAEEWFWDFAAKYSMAWNLSLSTDYDELRRLAKSQWGEAEARAATSSFRRLDRDIADERVLAREQDRPFNPRLVWYLHLRHAPVLAHAAVALLSVAGSEASVERTFSAQGDVHTDRRNRLADEVVEAEMFIKFNEGTVKRMEEWERDMKATTSTRRRKRPQTAAPPCGREMDEDDEEDVDIPNIAGLFRRPERKDEKEEKQLPSPPHAIAPVAVVSVPDPPATDEVERFIKTYVKKYGIHGKYRWRDYNLQQLESAGAEWKPEPMRDTAVVLKRKIMAWVRGQTEQEADADVADAE
jgi:hAT family C-terminal dimerisation region